MRPPQCPPQSLSQMSSRQRVSHKTGWPYHPFSGHAFLTPNSRSVSKSCLQHTRIYPHPLRGPKPFRLSPLGGGSHPSVPHPCPALCVPSLAARESFANRKSDHTAHMLKTHPWLLSKKKKKPPVASSKPGTKPTSFPQPTGPNASAVTSLPLSAGSPRSRLRAPQTSDVSPLLGAFASRCPHRALQSYFGHWLEGICRERSPEHLARLGSVPSPCFLPAYWSPF